MLYLRRVKSLFFRSSDRIASIYDALPKEVAFNIESNPAIKQAIEKELRNLAGGIQRVVTAGQSNEWMLGNSKMDDVLNNFTRGRMLAPAIAEKWGGKNLEALAAFQARAEGGLGLSDRVWNLTKKHAANIERHMALGVYEGTSAKRLASGMKQFLDNPDALFRRVRDAQDKLILSKAALDYEPGRGVYRSAYKNALRLTRTETNRAYQQAENARRENMDFVLGVRVQRSSSAPYPCDICEAGVGDYPVGYSWDAWHPNCLCFSTDILPSNDVSDKFFEMETEDVNDLRQFDWGEKVQDIPDSMKDFMKDTNFSHYGH